MRRLLLVTHRSIKQEGGPTARWRTFARYLPEHGWEVDVVSARDGLGATEFDPVASRAVYGRARVMARVGSITAPAFDLAGLVPDAMPLSTLWIPRGSWLVRRRYAETSPDVVLATGPPMSGPLAARLGLPADAKLIVELRDLWAGNPNFDTGGRTLSAIEAWLLRKAQRVVACTPEAVADLAARHPGLAERVVEVPNGFDPTVWELIGNEGPAGDGPTTKATMRAGMVLSILHSGTLIPTRPLMPLLRALGDPRVLGSFRLILHGYLSPASRLEVESARSNGGAPIDVLPPSSWELAARRVAAADACLITQARGAGDATAIASKVYEYLALGKPVLCLTDGGATEAFLRRVGAAKLCARLDDPEGIVRALLRLRDGEVGCVPRERLIPYSRRSLAGRMAEMLDDVASRPPFGTP